MKGGVLDFPGRQMLFQGFGESLPDFQVRFWSCSDSWAQIASGVSVDGEAAKLPADAEQPGQRRSSPATRT